LNENGPHLEVRPFCFISYMKSYLGVAFAQSVLSLGCLLITNSLSCFFSRSVSSGIIRKTSFLSIVFKSGKMFLIAPCPCLNIARGKQGENQIHNTDAEETITTSPPKGEKGKSFAQFNHVILIRYNSRMLFNLDT